MMKKIISVFLVIALIVGLIMPVQTEAATIKISETKKRLYVGDTFTLKITGTKKAVKWSSSKKAVATVSAKGKVKAKKAGTVTITAKVGTTKKTCKITVEDRNSYTVVKDENGKPINLGGMEVIIRDWWTDGSKEAEPANDFERAQKEYRDWIQKTYNFTIKVEGISSWNTLFTELQDYVESGGDKNNYVFTLRQEETLFWQMKEGLYCDLSSLNFIDMNKEKWDSTIKELGTVGEKVYLMNRQSHEPRVGIYFNKRLLRENGIDPEEIYRLQRTHKWTWGKFEAYLKKLTKDTNGDGKTDQWAFLKGDSYFDPFTYSMVVSNGGNFVGRTADGKFTYELESENTMEALEKALEWTNRYNYPREEGQDWDYFYDTFKKGRATFLVGYEFYAHSYLLDMEDDFGFVAFPMGPRSDTYVDINESVINVIPNCYDKDRANKIAFAYSQYYAPVPGYESYSDDYTKAVKYFRDMTVAEETFGYMSEKTVVMYSYLIPGINMWEDIFARLRGDILLETQVEVIRDKWMACIEEANKQKK